MRIYKVPFIKDFYIDKSEHRIYFGGSKIIDTQEDYILFIEALIVLNNYLIYKKNIKQVISFSTTTLVRVCDSEYRFEYCEHNNFNISLQILQKGTERSLSIKVNEAVYIIEEPIANTIVSLINKFNNKKNRLSPFKSAVDPYSENSCLVNIGELKLLDDEIIGEYIYV